MRIFRAAPMLVLGAAVVAGCGASPGASAQATVQSAVQSAENAARNAAGGGSDDEPVDGCALLSAAEVEALIGPNDGPTANGSGCTWENSDSYYSVTIDVGRRGTAANGTLPPWEPALGPERTVGTDMRDINGAIEFVAGDRDCTVQVASNKGTADRDSGVALVPVLRSRI